MNDPDGREILVVDDDHVFRSALGRAFRRRGFSIREADSVAGARSAVTARPPDLAVVDLKLPDGSGLEVVEFLHAGSKSTRIVVLTGYASIATAVEAVKLGATNYLMKPASPDEILRVLDDTDPDPRTPIASPPVSVGRIEWEHIQRVLAEHGGNVSATARALRMHRRTLQRKLAKRPLKE
ncbi:MAG: response regulator transcription factor [Pseudomonadales bacterium]|nr:response regulator transcription factor [Pseudomonadales bacterium]